MEYTLKGISGVYSRTASTLIITLQDILDDVSKAPLLQDVSTDTITQEVMRAVNEFVREDMVRSYLKQQRKEE